MAGDGAASSRETRGDTAARDARAERPQHRSQQQARVLVEQLRDRRRPGPDLYLTTRTDALLGWARKHSLAPFPFVGGCCASEVAALFGPRSDLERFGAGPPRFSPRHSDLLLAAGTVTLRQAPALEQAYEQMPEPRWVAAVGACACSGGPYDNYATLAGIDEILPVDVYIPGCPPRPEAVLDGLVKLQARVQAERVPAAGRAGVPPPV